uniref:Uncharacterized protein n=1 Tax=Toxoplasma gondii COUG TaxID=1074873 RepID=A0A2G8YAX4_TOXGO|nr:hypothetical protein TGCOUG_249725A [Toxoplasma gondii COUG]
MPEVTWISFAAQRHALSTCKRYTLSWFFPDDFPSLKWTFLSNDLPSFHSVDLQTVHSFSDIPRFISGRQRDLLSSNSCPVTHYRRKRLSVYMQVQRVSLLRSAMHMVVVLQERLGGLLCL